MKRIFVLLASCCLLACGGGSGGGTPLAAEALPLMVDSLNRSVPENDFGRGDSDAAGADGTAGDGAPIPNANITLTDNAGHSATTKSDAQGYYRLPIKGFAPPFVVRVVRSDGTVWTSPSVTPVKKRGFVTINLTGLTDYVASEVAITAGKLSSAQLDASTIAANPTSVQNAKNKLNAQISSLLLSANLDPTTFDPVTLPFKTDLTGYDKVLEGLVISNTPSTPTVFGFKGSVGGSISGLGAQTGLSLINGTETLSIPASASAFAFTNLLAVGATYDVSIKTQPAGMQCALTNGSGTMSKSNVRNVAVTCSELPSLGGTISGLGSATGLVLANGTDTIAVQSSATSFVFSNRLALGSTYNVSVKTQPNGLLCTVTNGSGTANSNVSNVAVACATPPAICTTQFGSGSGSGTQTLDFGAVSFPIKFQLSISPYGIPDRFRISQNGTEIYNSGFVYSGGPGSDYSYYGWSVKGIYDGDLSPVITLSSGAKTVTVVVDQITGQNQAGSGSSSWGYSLICQ